jgi:hypothetical protein
LSRRALAPAMIVALLGGACSRAPSDPVRLLLAELETAAEERDAARFAARLSERFQGQEDVTKPAAEAELRRYFSAYESIRLELYDVEIDRQAAAADIRCKVAFSGQGKKAFGLENLLPPSALYRFELSAADQDGTWRVVRARWEALTPRASSSGRGGTSPRRPPPAATRRS